MTRGKKRTRRRPKARPWGTFLSRPDGFGFVRTAEGEYFIPTHATGGAFDGDLVEVSPLHGEAPRKVSPETAAARKGGSLRDAPAARVLRVIDRAHDTLVGRYEVAEPFGVVVPSDAHIPYDVFTRRADFPDVPDGALVRVRLSEYPTRNTAATGIIEEVLADSAASTHAGVDVIIGRHKLETKFSTGALDEAAAATLGEDEALRAGYRDLRERFVFTIDPADAKDFDDALSLERVEGREGFPRGLWRLGVHIADVSHYVPWACSLDLDARRRATSVYLVDRVIPMLPPALSDDLCSLKPNETRRSMTVDMYVTDTADIVQTEMYPALIRSRARLTYDEADALLDGEAAMDDEELSWRLAACSRFAQHRARARLARGGIDFESSEAKVVLDEQGRPVDIAMRRKTRATMLVEEAMIAANEAVATYLEKEKFPCIYRVHEPPASDALAALVPVFEEFSWFTPELAARLVAGQSAAVQDIIDAARGRSEGELVSSLLLRSMKRAVYRPDNRGHFGLASGAYCHFTSPIRRYPDLVVHRMLRAALSRRPEKFDREVAALPWIAEHASEMERVADTAARQSQELKMVEYLTREVGTKMSAVVSGVATYGIYVRLDCTAEGVVPLRALGDEYFELDAVRHMLIGEQTGRIFRLGQRIAVVLKVADVQTATLEFALA